MMQLLVHSTQNSAQDSVGVVYSIPCKDCPKVYIDETDKRYDVRDKELMKDANQLEKANCSRTKKRDS